MNPIEPKDFLAYKKQSEALSDSVKCIKKAEDNVVSYMIGEKYAFPDKKKEDFFIIVKDSKDKGWKKIEKKAAKTSTGECKIHVPDEGKPSILIKSAKGKLKDSNVVKMVNVLFKDESAFKDPASNLFSAHIAQASHDKAKTGRTIGEDVKLKFADATLELPEFVKFKTAFDKFLKKYDFSEGGTLTKANEIWKSLISGLVDGSKSLQGDLMKVGDLTDDRLILAVADNKFGKLIRSTALQTAMDDLSIFTKHAGDYLEFVISKVKIDTKWYFWSGACAEAMAKKQKGSIALESTVGSWFSNVWDFQKMTGFTNFQIWTSLSELYAKKAAINYKKFIFEGYLGPGAATEQNVFNKIEQPTFEKTLMKNYKISPPPITWNVLNCRKNTTTKKWELDESSPLNGIAYRSPTRKGAIAELKKLYGG